MAEDTDRDMSMYAQTLYVGNLEHNITEEEIISVFEEFKPEFVKKLRRDVKCFAFVQLSSPEDALRAIDKLNQTVFNGRRLILRHYCEKEWAPKISDLPQTQGARQDVDPAAKPWKMFANEDPTTQGALYIGNLPLNVTEEDLQNLLKGCDPVDIRIHQRGTKCIAIVTLRTSYKVAFTVSMINGGFYRGRKLICKDQGALRNLQKATVLPEKLPEFRASESTSDFTESDGSKGKKSDAENAAMLHLNHRFCVSDMVDMHIFIGNLPWEMTEMDIHNLFKDYEPENINRFQRNVKCFAFVKLRSPEKVQLAVNAINGRIYKGRRLICKVKMGARKQCVQDVISSEDMENFLEKDKNGVHSNPVDLTDNSVCKTNLPDLVAKDKHDTEGTQSPASNGARSDKQILIGNIPRGTSKTDLHNLLKDYEPEDVIKFQHNRKYFAYLTLRSSEDARLAVSKFNGCFYKGHRLMCNVYTCPRDMKQLSSSSEEWISLLDLENIDTEVLAQDESHHSSGMQDNERKHGGCVSAASAGKEVHVSNLPHTVTEEEIASLLESFHPVHIDKHHNGDTCSAVVELKSFSMVSQAVQRLNFTMFRGQQLNVQPVIPENISERQESQMPQLEYVFPPPESKESFENYFGKFLSPSVPFFKKTIYTMPLEMRGSFLCCMLRDCTKDLTWLPAIMNTSGEVSLLVTNVFPNSPYFWAVLVHQEIYARMTKLFIALSKVVGQLPYLSKRDVKRGLRCLAQCVLFYGEDTTWNRCWVVDVILDLAVVYMLDYGVTATVPIQSLRPLDSDRFWTTPPLAQPFFLQDGLECIDFLGTVISGNISGSCQNERHVLMFTKRAHEE